MNKVIDTELYDIDNQSEGDVFVSMMKVKMRIICLWCQKNKRIIQKWGLWIALTRFSHT